MTLFQHELNAIASEMDQAAELLERSPADEAITAIVEAASTVGLSWCGSWLGYHSCVYYKDLSTPPPGAHFSSEWGLKPVYGLGSKGDWREYSSDFVRDTILQMAGDPNLKEAGEISEQQRDLFARKKEEILSILEICRKSITDDYFAGLVQEVGRIVLVDRGAYISSERPGGSMISRDAIAATQGLRTPPHVKVIAYMSELGTPTESCKSLAAVARQAAAHIQRVGGSGAEDQGQGGRIFLGHGHSNAWRELKDFLKDRLDLEWDEFNRQPNPGVSTTERLATMLNEACFAFLIMTAEEEDSSGSSRARMNVIHEVGLFQGRLGNTKAIVMLEEGCEEFSNIASLTQIRFQQGRISDTFEDVRLVLEREGIIS